MASPKTLEQALFCNSRAEARDQRYLEGLNFYPEKAKAQEPPPGPPPSQPADGGRLAGRQDGGFADSHGAGQQRS